MATKFKTYLAPLRLSVFILASLTMAAAVASESIKVPKYILRPALCAGMLKTGSTLTHENPLPSLRDARYLLNSFRKDPKGVLPTERAYENAAIELDLDRPSRSHGFFGNRRIETAAARLAQLEKDSTEINFTGTTVGYEFRGAEQVTAALQTMTDSMSATTSEALRLLRKQYPIVRPAVIARAAAPLVIGSFMPVVALSQLGLHEGLTRYNERYRTVAKIQPQLRLIEETLSGQKSTKPFSIFSGKTYIKTDLHKMLMDIGTTDLDEHGIDMIADASQDFYSSVFDPSYKSSSAMTNEYAQHPEGMNRYIRYDSIFFVDSATNEPVWLIYYRAMKTNPIGPKSPGKKKQEVRETEGSWIPGLAPSLVPVRAR